MAITVFKTFSAGEILTAADLNDSFSKIVDNGEDVPFPATKAKDFNGQELILDQDADTVMVASTDDRIDFKPGAVTLCYMSATELKINKFLILNKGSDIASASALTLGGDGNIYDVTGTTAITSIDTVGIGTVVWLHFDDAVVITHDGSNIVIPGSANYTTSAGDEVGLYEYDTGMWRVFTVANGSIIGANLTQYRTVALWFPGSPTAAGVMLGHVFDAATTFPASLTNSQGYALTASSDGTAQIDIQKNGVSAGTVNFAIGSNTSTFTFSSETSFAAGDRLTLVAPNPADSTLADVMISLQGTRD